MNVQGYASTDQASNLRALVQSAEPAASVAGSTSSGTRILAIASGKGGVGKTNLSVNLGLALAQGGQRIWLLDGDMSLANVDVVMGLRPPYTLGHVLSGQKSLSEIMITGPCGLRIVPGASGLTDLASLPTSVQERLLRELTTLEEQADVLIIDSAAGIGTNVLPFLRAAQEAIIITTPEPTAITDAYALIKVLSCARPMPQIKLLVNWARNEKDANLTARKMADLIHKFLDLEITILGSLPEDEHLMVAVRKQVPVLLAYPGSPYAKGVRKLGRKLDGHAPPKDARFSLERFIRVLGGLADRRTYAVS